MIFNHLKNFFVPAAAFLVLAGTAVPALAAPVKNIVLVHGAFVDGSGWKGVYDILVKDGYNVTLVQQPLTSLAEDVAATKRILDRQPGPCILVGHSYGGAVITEAGTDSHVVASVYIAAHAPEEGETEAARSSLIPAGFSISFKDERFASHGASGWRATGKAYARVLRPSTRFPGTLFPGTDLRLIYGVYDPPRPAQLPRKPGWRANERR
jgi:pimeloyl-ACP methyl ester carboxylesterase